MKTLLLTLLLAPFAFAAPDPPTTPPVPAPVQVPGKLPVSAPGPEFPNARITVKYGLITSVSTPLTATRILVNGVYVLRYEATLSGVKVAWEFTPDTPAGDPYVFTVTRNGETATYNARYEGKHMVVVDTTGEPEKRKGDFPLVITID